MTVPATTVTTTGPPPPVGAAATFAPPHLMLGPGAFFEPADDPGYVSAVEATWMEPRDVVLGVVRGGEAVAFPVNQMSFHHISNAMIGGEPFLVTY